MDRAKEIIKSIARESRKAILFHSGSGKDSIALLHLMSSEFDEIVCVYMYVVKDLKHINRYISYAVQKYRNVRFIQAPHFCLSSFVKYGYMGCKENPKQKLINFAEITKQIRAYTGIEWAFYGFKKSDSMNRRLMLSGYRDEAINYDTKKCYPLSNYKNKDVLKFIDDNDLVKPESYGGGQSSGVNITAIDYLLFLREKYPNDLKKVIANFPHVERILFEYDYEESTETE